MRCGDSRLGNGNKNKKATQIMEISIICVAEYLVETTSQNQLLFQAFL